MVGRDGSGAAAAALLGRRGVSVTQVEAGELAGANPPGREPIELVVVSCGAGGMSSAGVEPWVARGVPVIGERELAFQQSYCLHVAVTGGTGKRTTAELVAHLLRASGRRVDVAAGTDRPACDMADGTRDLDFLVHAVAPEELEFFQYFRPVVAVLINAPARDDVEAGEAGIRRYARLVATQQPFDWAVVESKAMARLEAAGLRLPGKGITFSAESRRADIGFDRGLLVSRIEGWSGPLWDMARGHLKGHHFAEDAMAALAVGRVLRLGLDEMTTALAGFEAPPGRFEWLGEIDGVRYVHDGCANHLEALDRALVALSPTAPESPYIWLIAGGVRAGRHFYDLGPVLSPRVKHAFVLGEAASAMQSAWQLFTPCTPVTSLLDAANRAVEQATPGDVILYSPGCPSGGTLSHSGAGTDVFRDVFRARLQRAGGSESGPVSNAERPPLGRPGDASHLASSPAELSESRRASGSGPEMFPPSSESSTSHRS